MDKVGVDNVELEWDHPQKYPPPPEKVDPWALPEFVNTETPWAELSTCGRIKRIFWDYIGKILLLIGLLYLFIVSLDFLSSAFKLLGGKSAGQVFQNNELLRNPVCGLMIGVLVTVLVQSSSTSTSLIITMVGAGFLTIDNAVFIIMGANIGTTVTNTIVSIGQLRDRAEYRRAFAGATVHDMFNWLAVLIFLPLEAASGMLRRLTAEIVNSFHIQRNKDAKQDILKVITKPLSSLVVKLEKNLINGIAIKSNDTIGKSLLKRKCSLTVKEDNGPSLNVTAVHNMTSAAFQNMSTSPNVTDDDSNTSHKVICNSAFSHLPTSVSDEAAGAILLVAALLLMCICLALIVKILHSLLKGTIAKVIRKTVNADFPSYFAWLTGYVAILVGAGLTIVVQSSSIFTSALTPLVGVGVITLERMYPLTLGANIGTTTTGILAALAQSGEDLERAMQVALCHLFFNIFGIVIWYPVPFMRKVPITLAKGLGNTTAKYRWFAIFYLFLMFFILPALVFALSIPGWYVLLGVAGPFFLLFIIVCIINILQNKRPSLLPKTLRTWNWLPRWMHSLEPVDSAVRRLFSCCKCCQKTPEDDPSQNGHPPMVMVEEQSKRSSANGSIIQDDRDMKEGYSAENPAFVKEVTEF